MEVVHVVVQEKLYNFFKFLMRDLEANMHTRQPFLIYPRFVTKVITSQLDFGGVTYWYPGAQVVLQEDMNVPSYLVPTQNHTGRRIYLWVYATCFHNDQFSSYYTFFICLNNIYLLCFKEKQHNRSRGSKMAYLIKS
ncbi:hypothetical protein Hanom_Chr03g00234921 [Helianthus anomalus]